MSDVATAVLLGADTVMLSDETANGKYPIETIKAMKKVILYTQANQNISKVEDEIVGGEYKNYNAVAESAVNLAEKIGADVIIAATKTGATAEALAAQRPSMPMISVTSDPRVAGQLALAYANASFVRPYDDNYAVDLAQDLKTSGYLITPEGKDYLTAVLVSGLRDEEGGTNRIEIRKI